MIYHNPVLSGFYPDPSVCKAGGKYYMVCSSFQYFPGVPLFESSDLVNWEQIGYVLTRKSQVALEKVNSSGGVFAPTIRYSDGRFYMVTTNDTTHENFYVYTDDIYGEWSDPVTVEQDGIDPSLYFEEQRAYFMSNGTDDEGRGGVVMCEIDIASGKKLSRSVCVWQGSGGRFLESPHLYKINGFYYIMAAEGGTEYGHMITLARANDIWGEYTGCPYNPILTNRNKAPYIIQGIGHGDLVQDDEGGWHILSLGFRQIHMWLAYHTLGREVFLTPARITEDGWIAAGDGTTDECYELCGDFVQKPLKEYTFSNTDVNKDWCFMRFPVEENYKLGRDGFTLHGGDVTLDTADGSPTFIALRQRGFEFEMSVKVDIDVGEAGAVMYMCEQEHYEAAVRKCDLGYEAVLRLNIGGVHHEQSTVPLSGKSARLIVRADALNYRFYVEQDGRESPLGSGQAKYLSTEVSGGFTGVMTGLYAVGENTAKFSDLSIIYKN